MVAPLELEGRWVLVTGASAGIGEAFARGFAARGANIIAVARRKDRLEQLASRLATKVEVVVCDLESPTGPDELIREIERRGLRVDHVVNNAGFGGGGGFEVHDADLHAKMIELNCVALTRLTRHYYPQFVERNEGGFIQIASLAGFVPTPFMAVYGATKAFVLNLTAALAEELKDTNVRMLAVCPGPVPTEFQQRAGYQLLGPENKAAISAEEVVKISMRAYERGKSVVVPGNRNAAAAFLSRLGSPEFLARAAAVTMRRMGRDKVGR
jgi:short-subunit dehydrogenase